jgi:ABC-type multidrug transport system ATPase subunit
VSVIETTGLGKRYGKAWALRDCTLAVPEGCLAALVGPNGSGKSTLMNMAVGLTLPTAGTAAVLDGQATGSPVALDDIEGTSVLLSSHALAELERVADYLIVLGGGRLRIVGEVEGLLATHRVLTGPAAEADRYASELSVVQARRGEAQAHLLVRSSEAGDPVPPGWEAHPVSLEELTLAYLRAPQAEAPQQPASTNHVEPTEVAR